MGLRLHPQEVLHCGFKRCHVCRSYGTPPQTKIPQAVRVVKYPFDAAEHLDSGGYSYPAPGRCIYCGSTEQLSREHIVPFGLFGDLILQKGSCESCRIITGALETSVLQGMFGIHRKKYNYRSQSSKKRRKPAKLKVHVVRDDGTTDFVDLTDHQNLPGNTIAMPIFGAPGLSRLVPLDWLCTEDGFRVKSTVNDLTRMLDKVGGENRIRFKINSLNQENFCRVLAKIAHSYAVATLGENSFVPLLREFIIKGNSPYRMFVGGGIDVTPPVSDVYSVCLGKITREDGFAFLAARIRLVSYLGTPEYTVVVGHGFQDDILTLQHGGYAKPIEISHMPPDGKPGFRH